MKIIVLMAIGLLTLTGCQTNGGNMKNSISFEMDNQYWPNHGIVYKNNWPECGNLTLTPDAIKKQKYITTYSSCKVSPEGYVPQQIIIEYAPWLTMEQVEKILGEYPQQVLSDIVLGFATEKEKNVFKIWNMKQQELIEKIPATAWKRIVLTPPKEVEKYKDQVPEGSGNRSRGKNIHYIISLQPDGSYSIETKLYWTEPYQKNWN